MPSREQAIEELKRAGQRRRDAIDERRRASEDLADTIRRAYADGVRIHEIVELTGVSRQGVRDFLKQ